MKRSNLSITSFFAKKVKQTQDQPSTENAPPDFVNDSTEQRHPTGSHEMVLPSSQPFMEDTEPIRTNEGDPDNLHQIQERSTESQFIPDKKIIFPKTNGRACNHAWFAVYKWLHYDELRDVAMCFTCISARRLNRKESGRASEEAFISKGFRNWKKASKSLGSHEKSAYHINAAHYVLSKEKGNPVVYMVSTQSLRQQEDARTALRVIISSLRYLSRSGQAIRGASHETGNLLQLLEERAEDVQNEIIEVMAHSLQRDLVQDVKESPFYAVMADGTTDNTGKEQFTLCVRYVTPKSLEIHEVFMGMYVPPESKAETLHNSLQDMIIRLGFSTDRLRGHCFDGAANMSGRITGLQKRLTDIQPMSIYVHCSNHALDLALQEIARATHMIGDTLSLVKDVSNTILESSKRRAIYTDVVLPPCRDQSQVSGLNLLPLCMTRWAVRANSINRFIANYERISVTLRQILNDPTAMRDDRRASTKGYLKVLCKFETLLSLNISYSIFGPCEELARALQSPSYTASGAKQAADALGKTLEKLRTDEQFNLLWDKTKAVADRLELKMPQPSRATKPPSRFEQSSNPIPPVQLSERTKLRVEYFRVVDNLLRALQDRFDKTGLQHLIKLESVIFESAKPRSVHDLDVALGVHKADFNLERLSAQLVILPTILDGREKTVADIAVLLKSQSTTTRELLDQVERLVVLLLTVPASAATSERSFSGLRRVKTYLRTGMTQKRLTHLLLLHLHEGRTANLCLKKIIKEFTSRTAERKAVFGVM